MKKLILLTVLLTVSFLISRDKESGGICLADYGYQMQCYDCWEKDLCEEGADRTWYSEFESCSEAGYTVYFGNDCGYYMY